MQLMEIEIASHIMKNTVLSEIRLTLEICPNFGSTVFWAKVRTRGSQPSICVPIFIQFTTSNHIPVRSHPDPSWFGIGNVRSSISDREQFSYDHVSSCSRFTLRCLRFPSHLAQVSANFPLNLQKWCATICMESGFFTCHQSSCSRLLANVQVSGQNVPTFRVIYHYFVSKYVHFQRRRQRQCVDT